MKVTKSQLRQLITEAVEDSSMQSTQMSMNSIKSIEEQIERLKHAAARIKREIPFEIGDGPGDRAAREAANVMTLVVDQLHKALNPRQAADDTSSSSSGQSVFDLAQTIPAGKGDPSHPDGIFGHDRSLDEAKLRAMIKDVLTGTTEK